MKATVFTEYGSLDIHQVKDGGIPTQKAPDLLIKVYAPRFLYNKNNWGQSLSPSSTSFS